MERTCMTSLHGWLNSKDRLPLVLRGARQVGKTWVVRQLAKESNRTLIEINLEFDPDKISLFSSNDPEVVLEKIRNTLDVDVDPKTCILFIDEIQVAPELIAKLRWFAERMPELPVVTAGSLLEFVLGKAKISMPVGRIDYLYLEPMSFEEFLDANHKNNLVRSIKTFTFDDGMTDYEHKELTRYFREYVIVGGMPAAVAKWVESRTLKYVSIVQRRIYQTYKADFSKYTPHVDPDLLEKVLDYVPGNLGKKFVYSHVTKEVSIDIIKKALRLLCKARICHKVYNSDANGVPLLAEASEKFFKALMLDVGLCSAALKLSLADLESIDDLTLVNSGGIAEQVVGQALRTVEGPYFDPSLYYWIRPEKESNAEVDYVIQHKTDVVPIEVKSGKSGTLRSLHVFMAAKKAQKAVRFFSAKPYKQKVSVKDHQGKPINYQLYSLPFYLISDVHRLLGS